MKRILLSAAAGVAALVCTSGADATVTLNLSPLDFADGGSVSGSISLNDDETTITGYDLTTSAGSSTFLGIPGFYPFPTPGTHYSPANSIPINIPLISTVDFAANDGTLEFSGVAVTNGGVSFERAFEFTGFLSGRGTGPGSFTASGSISPTAAVPELGTWLMMIIGFGLIGGAMRRAHGRSEDKFTAKVRAAALA